MDRLIKTSMLLAMVAMFCTLYATGKAVEVSNDQRTTLNKNDPYGQEEAELKSSQETQDVAGNDGLTTGGEDGADPLTLDPKFVSLIRNLVYKIEVLAEEENLRKEIESMAENSAESREPNQFSFQGARAQTSGKVGLDATGVAEAQAAPAVTSGADELSEELMSLQRHGLNLNSKSPVA